MTTPHKNSERVPHIHKDLIIAWADGSEVQWYDHDREDWYDTASTPLWSETIKYRLKPIPEVRYVSIPLSGWITNVFPESVDRYSDVIKVTYNEDRTIATLEKVN